MAVKRHDRNAVFIPAAPVDVDWIKKVIDDQDRQDRFKRLLMGDWDYEEKNPEGYLVDKPNQVITKQEIKSIPIK